MRGLAAYVDDIVVPGALFGATVRSDVARGRLRAIVRDPAFDWTGITFVTHEDIPGENVVALIEDDQPVLAAHGDPPLLRARRPPRLRRPGAPPARREAPSASTSSPCRRSSRSKASLARQQIIHKDDNVQKRYLIEHELGGRSIDGLIAGCDVVLEGTYRVPHQEQLYIEPQGHDRLGRRGGVHVHGSLQCPYYVHKALKRAFAETGERVRVIQAVTGGGFGGKEEYPPSSPRTPRCSRARPSRPVQMSTTARRHEATTKRHPAA